jgi:hypothetical protein
MSNIIYLNMRRAGKPFTLHTDGIDDIDWDPEVPSGPASRNAYLMLLDLTGYIKDTHYEEPIPLSGFRKWLQGIMAIT